jgi:phage shock protein PspC (stress-responsive transcriptional regulator)
MMEKKLHKSKRYKIIAGVCGGIAEYFNIDPLIVRLIFIFTLGGSFIIYLILALLLTDDNDIKIF